MNVRWYEGPKSLGHRVGVIGMLNLHLFKQKVDKLAHGPWVVYPEGVWARGGKPGQVAICRPPTDFPANEGELENLEFIATCRTLVPVLIEAISLLLEGKEDSTLKAMDLLSYKKTFSGGKDDSSRTEN